MINFSDHRFFIAMDFSIHTLSDRYLRPFSSKYHITFWHYKDSILYFDSICYTLPSIKCISFTYWSDFFHFYLVINSMRFCFLFFFYSASSWRIHIIYYFKLSFYNWGFSTSDFFFYIVNTISNFTLPIRRINTRITIFFYC